MSYTAADFKAAQFATHEEGHVAMRLRSRAVSAEPGEGVWQREEGGMCQDHDMPGLGYMPAPNLADALIEQQQTMQDSLDEAIREVRTAARCEALQDAQQIIAGDQMVDEARGRDVDRVSVGRTIRELDVEIRESASGIKGAS